MRHLIPLIAVLLAMACRKDKGECPANMPCTMEFRTITVEVRDMTGVPVVLDSTVTVRPSDGMTFHFDHGEWGTAGTYVVLTDMEMPVVKQQVEDYYFRGYLGGQRIVDQRFGINHDCCHVQRSSGPTVIVAE